MLLQLTDLHLFADPAGRLLGQTTARTLEAVLALAQARHWPPAAVVLTGDLLHDAEPAGYRSLRERMDRLLAAPRVPWFALPGNHDARAPLAQHLDPTAADAFRVRGLGAWDLALLDSTIPGAEGGQLAAAVLEGLDRHLTAAAARPTLVCLHHQPLPVGSRWIDGMQVANGAHLLALARRHANLRGILWGHVHQAFQATHGHALLLGSPSTCVQFLPGSAAFALDTRTPGYRWLRLFANGRITTGIERIDAYPEPLHARSRGY